ncbi:MAG: hypothetical protein ABI645_02835 [Pseudomonadota bacterium]
MAAGADFAFLGRPFVFSLAARGVEHGPAKYLRSCPMSWIEGCHTVRRLELFGSYQAMISGGRDAEEGRTPARSTNSAEFSGSQTE